MAYHMSHALTHAAGAGDAHTQTRHKSPARRSQWVGGDGGWGVGAIAGGGGAPGGGGEEGGDVAASAIRENLKLRGQLREVERRCGRAEAELAREKDARRRGADEAQRTARALESKVDELTGKLLGRTAAHRAAPVPVSDAAAGAGAAAGSRDAPAPGGRERGGSSKHGGEDDSARAAALRAAEEAAAAAQAEAAAERARATEMAYELELLRADTALQVPPEETRVAARALGVFCRENRSHRAGCPHTLSRWSGRSKRQRRRGTRPRRDGTRYHA